MTGTLGSGIVGKILESTGAGTTTAGGRAHKAECILSSMLAIRASQGASKPLIIVETTERMESESDEQGSEVGVALLLIFPSDK